MRRNLLLPLVILLVIALLFVVDAAVEKSDGSSSSSPTTTSTTAAAAAAAAILSGASTTTTTTTTTLVWKNIERKIDLTSHVVRHSVKLDLENTGSQPVSHFVLSLPKLSSPLDFASSLAYIHVKDVKTKTSLLVSSNSVSFENYELYQVQLHEPLEANAVRSFRLRMTFTHFLKPHPAEIAQNEPQLVTYTDFAHFPTLYLAKSQFTELQLPATPLESFTQNDAVQPATRSGSQIKYGPYSNIKGLQQDLQQQQQQQIPEIRAHFHAGFPFLTATHLRRDFEISHWGNLAVEEHFELRNDGARLKNGFSRLDYQKGATSASFRTVTAVLPASASDIYYRDHIGNISTSAIRSGKDKSTIELDIQPRFPMFGGWATKFYTGYNVPLDQFLGYSPQTGLYVFNTTFGSSLQQAAADELSVRVILPEGAKDIKAYLPFAIDSQSVELHKTYLDTTGRQVFVFTKHNTVDEHNMYFQVTYRFSALDMMHEPLLLFVGLLLFFSLLIAYNRYFGDSSNKN